MEKRGATTEQAIFSFALIFLVMLTFFSIQNGYWNVNKNLVGFAAGDQEGALTDWESEIEPYIPSAEPSSNTPTVTFSGSTTPDNLDERIRLVGEQQQGNPDMWIQREDRDYEYQVRDSMLYGREVDSIPIGREEERFDPEIGDGQWMSAIDTERYNSLKSQYNDDVAELAVSTPPKANGDIMVAGNQRGSDTVYRPVETGDGTIYVPINYHGNILTEEEWTDLISKNHHMTLDESNINSFSVPRDQIASFSSGTTHISNLETAVNEARTSYDSTQSDYDTAQAAVDAAQREWDEARSTYFDILSDSITDPSLIDDRNAAFALFETADDALTDAQAAHDVARAAFEEAEAARDDANPDITAGSSSSSSGSTSTSAPASNSHDFFITPEFTTLPAQRNAYNDIFNDGSYDVSEYNRNTDYKAAVDAYINNMGGYGWSIHQNPDDGSVTFETATSINNQGTIGGYTNADQTDPGESTYGTLTLDGNTLTWSNVNSDVPAITYTLGSDESYDDLGDIGNFMNDYAQWDARGFSPTQYREWNDAFPFYEGEPLYSDFSDYDNDGRLTESDRAEAAAQWNNAGFTHDVAGAWIEQGVTTPTGALGLQNRGIDPSTYDPNNPDHQAYKENPYQTWGEWFKNLISIDKNSPAYTGAGMFSSLFGDDDEMDENREKWDQFFAEHYLGSKYIVSNMCRKRIDTPGSNAGYIDTGRGVYFTAHNPSCLLQQSQLLTYFVPV